MLLSLFLPVCDLVVLEEFMVLVLYYFYGVSFKEKSAAVYSTMRSVAMNGGLCFVCQLARPSLKMRKRFKDGSARDVWSIT